MTAEGTPIRVVVVDDNAVVRSGLLALLGADDEIEVVGEADNGRVAVELVEKVRPDLVLLDVRMPLLGGVEVAKLISAKSRVLMLTYTQDPEVITAALRHGAVGYLVHGEFTPEELLDAVRSAVRRNANPLSAPALSVLMAAVKDDGRPRSLGGGRAHPEFGLSEREAEVMERIAQGRNNSEIARELFLAEKTVKNHVNRIYAKLGVENRAAAVARWLGTADSGAAS